MYVSRASTIFGLLLVATVLALGIDDGRINRPVFRIEPALADSCVSIPAKSPIGDQPRIAAQAQLWKKGRCLDKDFGAPCEEACVATVNHLVHMAVQKWLGGDPTVANTDVLIDHGDVLQLAKQSLAAPGDFLIVYSADQRNAHIGICLDPGCTDVISNSSSTCKFIFESAHNARFAYPRSPYINGFARYFRAKTSPARGGGTSPMISDAAPLPPLPVYATPAPRVVEETCVNHAVDNDMKLKRWAYSQGHLLCTTADNFTGGQQLYTETSPGHFSLASSGGAFRPKDLVSEASSVVHSAAGSRPIDLKTAAFLVQAVSSP